jgi:thiamine pyrophosphate-dependent acetolactate synthase large subunit-like protein
LHTAPGLGNGMGALWNAWWNKTPLIITAGNQRRKMQNQQALLTNVDATLFPRPVVKWAAEPTTAAEVPAVLAHAIHLAQSPPKGPVFVSLPMDDQLVELDEDQIKEIRVVVQRRVTHAGIPDRETTTAIAARLTGARSPAMVVGGEVERTGAWHGVVALAERLNMPVWSAPLPGLAGFPENHRLYRGELRPGAGWISETLTGHDLIIVLGAPVFRYYPHIPGPYLPAGATLVHITGDPDEAARAPVGDALVGDVRRSVEALLAQVEPGERPAPPDRTTPEVAGSLVAPMHPTAVLNCLAAATPVNALYVTESGSNEFQFGDYVRSSRPFSHLSAAGGGLGFGLPAAVGAQLAAPDRPVTAIMGDGSMHYAITALWTAATYNIPLTVIVLSNGEYGILKMFGDIEHTKGVPGLDIPGLDIVATAQSYGFQAHRAKSTQELEHLFREAVLDRDRPTLIDVPIVPVHAANTR